MIKKTADIYNEKCPSRIVLDIISNKWVILIIDKLSEEPYRFGELKRQIGGISAKVLTALLKMLEDHGLVIRKSYPVVPLKVEYSLSSLGVSLSNVCNVITNWAETHIHEITINKENLAS